MHPATGFEFDPPSVLVESISQDSAPEPPASLGYSTPSKGDLGPCLYFGPGGERCYRRAVRNGFCAIHQPPVVGARAPTSAKPSSKIIAAILGLLGMLLPFLDDVVRTILRWLHTH